MSVVLDTNIVIDHFRRKRDISTRLQDISFYIPRVVLGELYSGAFKSARPEYHRRRIDVFIGQGTLLEVDDGVTVEYARIWASLAQRGEMIPTNDIWIAASAVCSGYPLVTGDHHFERVSGLTLVDW